MCVLLANTIDGYHSSKVCGIATPSLLDRDSVTCASNVLSLKEYVYDITEGVTTKSTVHPTPTMLMDV